MSYLKTTEYEIHPTEAYRIIRSCAGCGCKKSYQSTGCFRVNANGTLLDVWLIYQCEKCGHTYNLPVFERVNRTEIPMERYQRFLANDGQEALRVGLDKTLFKRAKAEIDWEAVEYEVCPCAGGAGREECPFVKSADGETEIVLHNPYELKLRADKILTEILSLSRTRVRQMMKDGSLEVPQAYVGKQMRIKVSV